MTSKTRKHKSLVLVVNALLSCALLLVCVSCDKSNDAGTKATEFEIDEDYQRGPLTVHVRADKAEMTIAETVLLELEAAIEPGYEVKMPKVDKVLENFGIVDWDNLGDKLDENNNVVQTYQYRLEPFLSGMFAIPAFTFEFNDINSPEEDKYELTTEPIDIEVTSLLGEQRAELVIEDIEDVVQMSKAKSYFWLWALGIVVVIASGIVIWMYLRKKKKAELIRIFKPAHEIAYERLRALVKKDLVKAGKIKEFYEQISDILRHYIEHRFNLRAPERTTEEFLIELATAEVLGAADKEDLGEFLKHCDLVKFAKHNPTTEQIQKTFDLVKNFIEKTKSDEKKIDVTETYVQETVEVGSA
ncbi:MAG: hypothetical protein GWN67_15935 [Phycisphaerae bacterium]|nr:hypothetical protein [Phycisphaerae bacterium]NIP55370.1 hypothetical protein [Phycisphaerae bacterium]NIS52586.1 hypothetical protein [Phycisphaerae bacterium]NIU07785.1 hypothetical protein [Phycisphaerae bacterium]NIU57822.1 hypothetical protein [Phycisphaerae bacterium]